MRIKAIGGQLLVKLRDDHIQDAVNNSLIVLPPEVLERTQKGCQFYEVLSIGDTAFELDSPEDVGRDWVGRVVVTGRYPGHSVDTKPFGSDAEAAHIRSISYEEVHALIAEDDEEGADV